MTRSATSMMFFLRTAAMVMTLALGVAACHVDGTPDEVRATVGPEGGTVNGPDGVQVVIPAGALAQPTTIGIARSAAGAPALPEDITPAGSVYEFTPHDVIFNAPVIIRMPVPANAANAEALMASPGGDWQVQEATLITSQVAEWQRNSFSWGSYGYACHPSNSAPYSSSNPDPYPCWFGPSGGTDASATPASAITRTAHGWPGGQIGSAGSWTVNQASTVHLTVRYSAVPDCQNPQLVLSRLKNYLPVGDPNRFKVLFDQPVTITPTTLPMPGGIGTYVRAIGSTTIDVAFSHLDNSTTAFGSSFSCNRPHRSTRRGGDWSTFTVSIPTPTVFYTIGATVNGLTGTGLVLQNNGGDNTPVSTDGGFTFGTTVGAGSPYAVTVLNQPAGQTCTVVNGNGTASTNVTNMAVNCVAVATHTIGGSVTGLTGTGLVLRNNGGGNRAVTADGAFTFTTPINAGSAYNVTVLTQPTGQTCTVANGNGTANTNVTNVAITCTAGSAARAWQGATVLEADAGDAYSPQVVFDASGNGMAIWTQNDGTYLRIRSRRYTPSSGWSTIMPVDNGGAAMALNPKIAADGLGNIMAVWLQPVSATTTSIWTNLYSASSGWGTATLLENNVRSDGGIIPEIAMDPAGNATMVWYAFDGTWTNLWAKRYTAAGGAWGIATLIENDNNGGAAGQAVVMESNGDAMVVWSQFDFVGQRTNALANRYVVGNGWGTPTPIEASDLNAGVSDIALDGAGNIMVVLHQQASAASAVIGSLYTNRFSNGSWGTATLVKSDIPYLSQSSIAMNASGNAMLVWLEDDGFDTGSIWARAYTGGIGGAIVRIDNLSTFFDGNSPQVGIDASGNAVAVWGQGRHIWSARYVAGTGWGAATDIDSAAATVNANQQRIAVDPNGNALAVWQRSGSVAQDIWVNVFK